MIDIDKDFLIENAVKVAYFIVFMMGLFLIYQNTLESSVAKIKARKRLKERKRRLKEASNLEKHINQVSETAFGISGRMVINITFVLFTANMLVVGNVVGLVQGIVMATIISSTPYLLLRIRFESIRRKGSFEGEVVVSNFLNHYRIANFNVYEALEKLLYESENIRQNNPLLFKMLMELRNTGSPAEIKKATNAYAQVVNTNWSRMFAYNIQLAAEKGINVSVAIEDILFQLRDARTMLEERKRLNSEAMRIVVYMIPLLYVFTIVMSVNFIGLSATEYIKNQFVTQEGLFFLLLSVAMFLFNIILMETVSRQKFDY